MLRFLESLQTVLCLFFVVAYTYQFVYLLVGLFGRARQGRQDAPPLRYAVLVAARNEQNVIAGLIDCLKRQKYPADKLDIFVVADNCTDRTAEVARAAGATVYERFNKRQVGKGYALDHLLHCIFADRGAQTYDGFFVFDADNAVDPHFVAEMNKMFAADDYAALTSYRNSKNFCDNWISAGYALWFLREARYLNKPRARLGTSCAVSGTGFLIAGDVVREQGGWPYHLLTEDIEFSVCTAIEGRKIGYCGTAVVYDEQPTAFGQSWDQRLRWSKGFYQIDVKYMGALVRGALRSGRKGFSCYDLLMVIAPCNLLMVAAFALGLFLCVACFSQPAFIAYRVARMMMRMIGMMLLGVLQSFFLFGAVTMATEWKQIDGSARKKLLYVLTFPLFMLTYVPISIAALLQKKVEWKPIRHGVQKAQTERSH